MDSPELKRSHLFFEGPRRIQIYPTTICPEEPTNQPTYLPFLPNINLRVVALYCVVPDVQMLIAIYWLMEV